MKKAGELSILCESEAAVIIFSQTDKLLDFSSSRADILPHIEGLFTPPKSPHHRQFELTSLPWLTMMNDWKRDIIQVDLTKMWSSAHDNHEREERILVLQAF